MGNICESQKKLRLHLDIKIWDKKSYGLFDFNNKK